MSGCFSALARPPWPCTDNQCDVVLQLVETEYYIGFPPIASTGRREYRQAQAIIRLYGVSESGQSVLCHVCDFEPYFYVKAWDNFENCAANMQEKLVLQFQETLENRMIREHNKSSKYKCSVYVKSVSVIRKQSMWGFQSSKLCSFFKIVLSLPTLVASARRLLTSMNGFQIIGVGNVCFESFESNMTFILRFMIDKGIVGGGWFSIPSGQYALTLPHKKTSFCNLELIVPHGHVSALNDCIKIAPLRVLSFDIECNCNLGFPEANRANDQVLQISNVLATITDMEPFHKNVFCLDTCDAIAGAHVYCFTTEAELLLSWCKFVQRADPDILTGYNIINFDLPYLLDRAAFLRIASSFAYLGRIVAARTLMKDSQFSSRAYGSRASKDISIGGRIQLDLLPIIRREHKLRSYSLNSVSFHFLNQQKEEVAYNMISELQSGPMADSKTRRRLAVYCLKDSVLPLRLMQKLMIAINMIEMARVTGVPINFLITRGQQIKVLSQLYRKAKQRNLLIPFRERTQDSASGTTTFDGATVIEPMRGFYQTPVVTLDFASLYPSIMIAHNLCYTTLLSHNNDIAKYNLQESEYTKTSTNNIFVKASVCKGLLPEILEELLSARKAAKKEMKTEKNAFRKAVLNGRQLALKISANSVYGFTGATVGSLPCLSISASVTAFGREMIEKSRELVERNFERSTVIYGDTDSVMITFGGTDTVTAGTVAKAMARGKEAAALVSAEFITPIKLEYEKIYLPYLLMNKKRYAGMLWTSAVSYDYMDAKGIEIVRRDNCLLVKIVVQQVLNFILIECNVNKAIEYTKGIIAKLLLNKMDMSLLVITKQLSKLSEYKVKMAHVELAKRMAKRDPVSAPKSGDRIAYVIAKSRKNARAYEKAEDPLYALEHNIALDTEYYLENQLKKPLIRIFSPVLGDNNKQLNDIFYGAHTRKIKIFKSQIGSLMKFTVVRKTCIGCKSLINVSSSSSSSSSETDSESDEYLCAHCKENESLLYIQKLTKVQRCEQLFHKLWTECQRCQGSLIQPVLCSNRDCPIYYRRTKARKDLTQYRKELERF